MSMLPKDPWEFSYSQLTQFEECPYSYYLERISLDPFDQHLTKVDNAFAQYGTLIHSILDEWASGEITKEEMPDEYIDRYSDVVTCAFPRYLTIKGYAEKSYNAGLDYLMNFDGFKGYKVLNSEEKFQVTIEGRLFNGIIDLMLEDEQTGKLIVMDHKSKTLSTFRKEESKMYRQQYLYSVYVKEKYGRYPDVLAFNLFKEGGIIKQKDFVKEEYDEVIAWAVDIMEQIENAEMLDYMLGAKDAPDNFCKTLCNMREHCSTAHQEIPRKKR